jgi:hypothetical protein
MEEEGRVPEEAEAGLEGGPDGFADVVDSVDGLPSAEEVPGTENDDKDGGETDFDDVRDEDLGSQPLELD